MLTNSQTEQFFAEGYTVVPGILPTDTLARIQAAARQMGEQEPNRVSWNERSCFRRPPFIGLLDAPKLISIAQQLIGDDVQLLQFDLLRTRNGDPDKPEWHRDVEFACGKTLAVSIAIYLQDTPYGGGPLRAVPGTHRHDGGPPQLYGDLPGQIAIPVPEGAAIVHDSALWHTATIDGPAVDCWALFPIFGKFWIKRRDVDCIQLPPAQILKVADPMKRQLLGFKLRPGIQPYLGDGEQYNRRGDPGVDFPDPLHDMQNLDVIPDRLVRIAS